eukprot:Clim_evm49s149 gene=Clim_evmTU49s149
MKGSLFWYGVFVVVELALWITAFGSALFSFASFSSEVDDYDLSKLEDRVNSIVRQIPPKAIGICYTMINTLVLDKHSQTEDVKFDVWDREFQANLDHFVKSLSLATDLYFEFQVQYGFGLELGSIDSSSTLIDESLNEKDHSSVTHVHSIPELNDFVSVLGPQLAPAKPSLCQPIQLIYYLDYRQNVKHRVRDENMGTGMKQLVFDGFGSITFLDADADVKYTSQHQPLYVQSTVLESAIPSSIVELLDFGDHDPLDFLRIVEGSASGHLDRAMANCKTLQSQLRAMPALPSKEPLVERFMAAIKHMTTAEQKLGAGKGNRTIFAEGAQHAKMALFESSVALQSEDMLVQLYFPEDHKYAIYVPLFLPVATILLRAVVQQIRGDKGS